ncbi:MAG: hypothetical protein ABR535_10425, partial [Pyrinomonadaceae bacterium]
MLEHDLAHNSLPIAPDFPETFAFAAFDARITYPSYKSFDPFIDTQKLKSLDEYIRERIRQHIDLAEQPKFYTGPYRLDSNNSDRPGPRMIYLSTSARPDSYFDLDDTPSWRPSPAAADFSLLMDFIQTLPFKATGRILLMYDDIRREVPAHRDHVEAEVLHEFIWLRTNFDKNFYMLNHGTNERLYVSGHSVWFDTVNQFHG